MNRAAFAAAFLLAACATAGAQETCPPTGYDRAALATLKAGEWAIADDAARNALARALTPCVASPDPALRDGIAFEALQHWLRARRLTDETMLALGDDLEARLAAPDPQGFERPFAALALAEVARADRIQAFLTPGRRERLIEAGTSYLRGVRDYRGFDEREGWRHGVAHGADLMMQLALNPALGKSELERMRDAIASQIAPEGHFYVYGESERLARPILLIAQRGLISEPEWTQWFAGLPAAGADTYSSQAGLARRHNLNAFLQTLWINARLSPNSDDDALLAGAEAALRALP